MGLKTVTRSIWSLNLGIVNCFLLRSTSGYALVDTGFEKDGDKILRAFKAGRNRGFRGQVHPPDSRT